MFYHTRSEFNILASNYLSIKSYWNGETDNGCGGEPSRDCRRALLRNKDVDVSLEGLIKFLERKKILLEDSEKSNAEGVGGAKECKIMIGTKRILVNIISPNIV